MLHYFLGKCEKIFYENADEGIKYEILNKFKSIYSDETISEFNIKYTSELVNYTNKVMHIYNFIIDGKYRICFIDKLNLIEFIQNLKRPFILKKDEENSERYYVCFVY